MRVITINTWKNEGNYLKRLDLLIRQLSTLDADVILMQECFQAVNGAFDTSANIARTLGLECAFTPARLKTRKHKGQLIESYSGLAILSKHPIAQHHSIELPSNKEDGGRRAQIIELSAYSKKFLFINIHLSHLKNSADLRTDQLTYIINHVVIKKNDEHFRIIGGDYNTTLSSPELLGFLKKPYMLKDSFENQQLKQDDILLNPHVKRCIDHLLMIPDKRGYYPVVKKAKVVLNKPEDSCYPSDHFGIMAELNIE